MQLVGQVKDVSLPEIFRLLKMSVKTGALRIREGKRLGEVFFRDGEIYYATSSSSGLPLGERLVKGGKLRQVDLSAALAEQRESSSPRLLGAILKEKDLVSEEALESYVQDQIADAVFSLFAWPNAEFAFVPGGAPTVDDIVVSLDAESVIMEGCRRVDEWNMIMTALGSLEKVPALSAPTLAQQVVLKRHEWDVLCFIDGRRDIHTIIADSGFDRFGTAKIIYGLLSAGLVVTHDPTLELLGQKVAVALKGPIDIYNLTFLTATCTSDISSHRRVEVVDGEEIEVQISAGIREDDSGSALVYFAEARTPRSVVQRMALETSGYVVLVNMNSMDSVLASQADIALMQSIGDRPYVVAAYASMVDERVSVAQIRDILGLPEKVPVVTCGLRDPEDIASVLAALSRLLP
jgi:hypothetical protein